LAIQKRFCVASWGWLRNSVPQSSGYGAASKSNFMHFLKISSRAARERVLTVFRGDKVATMGILDGKRLFITGVLTDASIAYGVAQVALDEGADIVLSGAGRGLSLTQRTARKLRRPEGSSPIEVIELDVTNPEQVTTAVSALTNKWGALDGALHAIGFAPAACLGDDLFAATWEDVSQAIHISTYSLRVLAEGLLPLFKAAGGGSIVGLDFDATVAWPAYNWMGVAKAGLESLNRYLARELGPHKVRCNLIAAGPLKTMAAKSIPGFAKFEEVWTEKAPLGWDVTDTSAAAKACAVLLSDWFPATTGTMIHVDGGFRAMGA
jgi:meromycolic acid enoyl-[acyl-carrier-protein] reductase